MEIELRIGSFKDGGFNPRVPGEYVNHLLTNPFHAFRSVYETVTIKQTSTESWRKIVRNGVVEYDIKRKREPYDIYELGARLGVSSEIKTTEAEYNNVRNAATLDRSRTRHSLERNGFRLDISEYADALGEKTYEVEIEIDEKRIDDFSNALERGIEMIGVVSYWEKRNLKDIIDGVNISPAQPVPLLPSVYISNNAFTTDYAVTSKVDGMRKLIVFSDGYVYMIVGRLLNAQIDRMNESLIIGDYIDDTLHGTILEGEYYSKPDGRTAIVFIFDVANDSTNINIRKHDLHLRLERAEKIIPSVNVAQPFELTVKKFFNLSNEKESIYTATQKALDWFNGTDIETDGLIYQHNRAYTYLTDTKYVPYKWKPVSKITNDFIYEKTDIKGEYYLKCGDKHNIDLFEHNGRRMVAKTDIDFNFNGLIVESGYDVAKGHFYPLKIRYDKPLPNSLGVCRSNFDSIIDPLTEKTIVGKTCTIMRKMHNNAKTRVMEKYFAGRVLDIGSGQGGDLSKWSKLYQSKKISEVTAVEPSQEKLEVFNSRALTLGKSLPSIIVVNDYAQNFNYTPGYYDTVAAFFSLTFFYESKEVFDKLVKMVCEACKEGSHFVFSVLNGTQVNEKLGRSGQLGNLETMGWQINLVDSKGEEFGEKISTTVAESWVTDVEEYVFNLKAFKDRLLPYFSQILSYTLSDNTGLISPEANGYSELNVMCVFKRNGAKYTGGTGGDFISYDDDAGSEDSEHRGEGEDDFSDVENDFGGVEYVEPVEDDENIDDAPELEMIDDDERRKTHIDNDVNVNLYSPPDDGAQVDIKIGENIIRAIGVDTDNLNFIHAVRASGVTNLSSSVILENIIVLARREFFNLDKGMLAGGYQSRLLEQKYGGYDFLPGSGGVKEVMHAYQKSNAKGISVIVKNPQLTIEELNNEARDEFVKYLQSRYLGERSAAELCSKVLETNILIVDISKPHFNWRENPVAVSSFSVRSLYNPVIGRVNDPMSVIQLVTRYPCVVLFSINNDTYFPAYDVYREYKGGELITEFLLEINKPKEEYNPVPEELKKNLVRVLRAKKALHQKYKGSLGEIYRIAGGYEIRMQRDHKKLLVGEDVEFSDVYFVNCPYGRAPPAIYIPKISDNFEWPARDLNTNIIEALKLGDVAEGNKIILQLVGAWDISSYHIQQPVSHLFKKYPSLRVTPEIRNEAGVVIQRGDTLQDIVDKNPSIFVARTMAMSPVKSGERAKTPTMYDADSSYRPVYTPSPSRQPVKIGEKMFADLEKDRQYLLKMSMIKSLGDFTQFEPTKVNPLVWIYPVTKRIHEGKWAISSSLVINPRVNQGKWWDRLPEKDIESVHDISGNEYVHQFKYDLHTRDEVQAFIKEASTFLRAVMAEQKMRKA